MIRVLDRPARDNEMIGVICRYGEYTYYIVDSLDAWRVFVKKQLGYY